MKLNKKFCLLGLMGSLIFTTPNQANAGEVGVTDSKILVGQTAATDGPAKALGQGMKEGLLAAFNEANSKGGVNGRKIELITYNDGYEPEKAIENTNKLIKTDKVFGLIGAVGTPTSKAIQPITTEHNVPFVGPFTGAGFLRDASLSNVVNVRGTYDQETESWIKHLTEDLNYDKVAILYQDDSFGRVGLAGVQKALKKRGLELVAEGKYKRNTTAVKSALLSIKKANPQAVVMVGAYKPIAEFIKLSRKVKFDPTFVNISFVGSAALFNELGADGKGVIISQVVPHPENTTIPFVKQYQEALKKHNASANYDFVSLEGYLVGRLFISALEDAGKDLTRKSFLDTIKNKGVFDFSGLKLTYGPKDNQGMDDIYITVIGEDGFKAVDKLTPEIVSK